MLNNGLVVTVSKHFAARLQSEPGSASDKVSSGFYRAVGRPPNGSELSQLVSYVDRFGWENYCRVLFNLNEFSFVD